MHRPIDDPGFGGEGDGAGYGPVPPPYRPHPAPGDPSGPRDGAPGSWSVQGPPT